MDVDHQNVEESNFIGGVISMARDMSPVLKRCRSLDLDPVFLGVDKKSNRKSLRAGKKISEYGLQMREKQKAPTGQFSSWTELTNPPFS